MTRDHRIRILLPAVMRWRNCSREDGKVYLLMLSPEQRARLHQVYCRKLAQTKR